MRIDPDEDYERALRRLARQWLRRAAHLSKKAGRGDVDAIHDLRTAVRRLRTILGLAKGRRARRLRKRAKAIGVGLGALRDLDVALIHVRASVRRGELFVDAGVHAWISALETERAAALNRLRRLLRRSFERWCRKVRAWTTTGKANARVHEALPLALVELVSECEDRMSPTDEASLHELRKAIKRLRYALQFFASALPDADADLAERLTQAQDRLGEHRDRLALAERAEREGDAANVMGEDPRELYAYARRLRDAVRRDAAVAEANSALEWAVTTLGPLSRGA